MGYKRKYKARRRPRKARKLGVIGLAKLTNPPKTYCVTKRDTPIVGTVDKVTHQLLPAFSNINNTFGDTADQVAILDDVGIAALGDSNAVTGEKYRIYDHSVKVKLRNLDPEPSFVRVTVIEAKKNIASDGILTRAVTYFFSDLVRGWDLYTAAANVTDAGTGTEVVYTLTGSSCTTSYERLTPYNSANFQHNFKILNSKQIKMGPGDDWIFSVKIPAMTYDPDFYNFNATEGADYSQLGYIINKGSRFILISVRGALGRQITDSTITGWMASLIGVETEEYAKVLKLTDGSRSFVMDKAVDTIASELEGPSAKILVQDTE